MIENVDRQKNSPVEGGLATDVTSTTVERSAGLDGAIPEGAVVTRSELAGLLETSEATIRRRWEQRIAPLGKDSNGRVVYSAKLVLETLQKLRPQDPVTITGENARLVFAEFARGVSPAQIVVAHGLHPELVGRLRAQYVELCGSVVMCADAVREIETLVGADKPLRDDLAIVTAISAIRKKCNRCGDAPASMCFACSRSENRKAFLQRSADAREREAAQKVHQKTQARDRARSLEDFGLQGEVAPRGPVDMAAPLGKSPLGEPSAEEGAP